MCCVVQKIQKLHFMHVFVSMWVQHSSSVQKCVSESITVNHSWPWRTLSVHESILSQAICRFYRGADRVTERRERRKDVCTERCEDVEKSDGVESFVIKMGFRRLVMSSMRVRYSSNALFVSLWWCTVTDSPTRSYNLSIMLSRGDRHNVSSNFTEFVCWVYWTWGGAKGTNLLIYRSKGVDIWNVFDRLVVSM